MPPPTCVLPSGPFLVKGGPGKRVVSAMRMFVLMDTAVPTSFPPSFLPLFFTVPESLEVLIATAYYRAGEIGGRSGYTHSLQLLLTTCVTFREGFGCSDL